MARDRQQADSTANKEMGAAGHEAGIDEPSDVGSAGLYGTPIHAEVEEAEEAGRQKANSPSR
jgi:hypothetical protein